MARLTTLGVKFSYAVETVKGTKPTKFTQLEEASSIGGISQNRLTFLHWKII